MNEVSVNGELTQLNRGTTVRQLLIEKKLQGKRVAVELNEEILSSGKFDGTVIQSGDNIEIVQAIGGG